MSETINEIKCLCCGSEKFEEHTLEVALDSCSGDTKLVEVSLVDSFNMSRSYITKCCAGCGFVMMFWGQRLDAFLGKNLETESSNPRLMLKFDSSSPGSSKINKDDLI